MINRVDLAIFGTEPAFAEKLYVGRPNLGDTERFIGRVREIFGRRWLTNNGPCLQEFEQRIAELVGVKHCVAMCNATVALEIVIRAMELKGQVIVPSFTFIATAHEAVWHGRPFPAGLFRSVCYIPGNLLNDGLHRVLLLIVRDQSVVIYSHSDVLAFDVKDARSVPWYGKWEGAVRPTLEWKTDLLTNDVQASGQE